jgi:hypothetical protein
MKKLSGLPRHVPRGSGEDVPNTLYDRIRAHGYRAHPFADPEIAAQMRARSREALSQFARPLLLDITSTARAYWEIPSFDGEETPELHLPVYWPRGVFFEYGAPARIVTAGSSTVFWY